MAFYEYEGYGVAVASETYYDIGEVPPQKLRAKIEKLIRSAQKSNEGITMTEINWDDVKVAPLSWADGHAAVCVPLRDPIPPRH